MLAAENGHAGCVEVLSRLEAGAKDRDGCTALILAATKGDTECVRILAQLEKGERKKDGKTALMEAACNNHLECVKILAPLERETTGGKTTALMHVAAEGKVDFVRVLAPLEKGLKDERGQTALMLAAMKGHLECVKLLLQLEKGLTDSDGRNARWYATGACKEALLVERCTCRSLFDAVQYGCEEHCRKFIGEAGASNDGKTALMRAAEIGSLGCVRILASVENGIGDADGTTSLMLAARNGHG